jgi:hypothetical protein
MAISLIGLTLATIGVIAIICLIGRYIVHRRRAVVLPA